MFKKRPPKKFDIEHYTLGDSTMFITARVGGVYLFDPETREPLGERDVQSGRPVIIGDPWRYETTSLGHVDSVEPRNVQDRDPTKKEVVVRIRSDMISGNRWEALEEFYKNLGFRKVDMDGYREGFFSLKDA